MTLEKLKKLEKDLGMKEKELQEVSTVVATGTGTLFFMFMTVDIHVHVVWRSFTSNPFSMQVTCTNLELNF